MLTGGVVCGVQGEDKSGKSSFALTFDQPIRHFEIDLGGFRRCAWRYGKELESGQLVSKPYTLPQQATRVEMRLTQSSGLQGVKELWYRFLTDYVNVLDGKELSPSGKPYNTVVIDSFTQLWQLCTMAYLQELQERALQQSRPLRERLQEIEYGEPNQRIRSMIFAARQMSRNLVLTCQMRDKHEDRLVDGQVKSIVVGREADAWRHLGAVVDLVVQTGASQARDGGRLVPVFSAEVMLCGLTWELVGARYGGKPGETPTWADVEAELQVLRG